MRSKG